MSKPPAHTPPALTSPADLAEPDSAVGVNPLARARLHAPPKSSMQSGLARTKGWVLQFAPAEPKRIDPLTGWYGSGDTAGQVDLHFPTKEAALDYLRRKNIPYEVEERRQTPAIKPKAYADNFRTDRTENWTH